MIFNTATISMINTISPSMTLCWWLQTSADLPVEIISLPYSDPEGLGRFRILLSGNNVRFETPFGLALEYDGLYVQSIVLPTELSGDVTGLCGNFNDVDDEKILPNGTDYTLDLQSDSRIGQYYEINDSTLDTYVFYPDVGLL